MHICVIDPFRMCPMHTRDDVVFIGRVRASEWTKAGQVKGTQLLVLDVSQRAVRTERTEPSRVLRARGISQSTRRRHVEICAVLSLRTQTPPRKFLALSFIAQVECMRELARVAFLAKSALVVFTNQMADA